MSRAAFIAGAVIVGAACGTLDDQAMRNADCHCRVQVPWDWTAETSVADSELSFRTGLIPGTTAAVRWYPKDEVVGTRSLMTHLGMGSKRTRRSDPDEFEPYFHYVDGYLAVDVQGWTYEGDTSLVRVIDMPDGWLVGQVTGASEEWARTDFVALTGHLRRKGGRPDGTWERFEGVAPEQTVATSPLEERVGHTWSGHQVATSRSDVCVQNHGEPDDAECAVQLEVFGAANEGSVLLWLARPNDSVNAAVFEPFVSAGLTVVSVDLVGGLEQVDALSVLGPQLDDLLLAIDHVSDSSGFGSRRIYLGGDGASGGAALLAAVERPDLAGVLLLDPLVDVGPNATLPEGMTTRLMGLNEGPQAYSLRSPIRYVSQLTVPTLALVPEWSDGGLDGERLDATAFQTRVPLAVHRVPQTDARALQPHAFDVFAQAMLESPQSVTEVIDARQVEQLGAEAGVQYRQRLKQALLPEIAPMLRVGQLYEGDVHYYVRQSVAGKLSPTHLHSLAGALVQESTDAKVRSEATWPQTTDFDRLQTAWTQMTLQGVVGPSTPEDCEFHGLAEAMHLYEEASEMSRIGVAYYDVPSVERTLAGSPLRIHYGVPSDSSADIPSIRAIIIAEFSNVGLTAVPVPSETALDVTLQWQRRLPEEFWYD